MSMEYGLVTFLPVDGQEREIRTHYQIILDIIEILGDPDEDDAKKLTLALQLFYVDWEALRDIKTAVRQMYQFIDMGDNTKKKSPRLVDWQKDYPRIIAPVNRVLGYELRSVPYDFDSNTGGVHWWTFLAAFLEIGGDCLYSQILNIRDKQARGKSLSKEEKSWLKNNRDIVDLKQRLSSAEEAELKKWLGGETNS